MYLLKAEILPEMYWNGLLKYVLLFTEIALNIIYFTDDNYNATGNI